MSDAEVALELLRLVLPTEPEAQMDKAKLLALFRECLAAVRGKAG